MDQLGEVVHYLLGHVEPPEVKGAKGVHWYQFPSQGPLELIVVKAARAVSGLNAIPVLIDAGYTQEAAVLMRTVDDFLDEITFVWEGTQRESMTNGQKKFIEAFFSETVQRPEEMLGNRRGPDRPGKDEIRAAQARVIGQDNPSGTQQVVRALDKGFDGFVHGGYPHSMELFGGSGRFALKGMRGTPYAESLWYHHAHYISRAFSVLALVVLATGDEQYKEAIVQMRKAFENSSDWPAGP